MATLLEDTAENDSARLDALTESRVMERAILAERLLLVADWADAHPGTGCTGVLSADEHPGGDGTPSVAAFTAEPVGHALQCSTREAQALLADTLDLRHRHPRLWDQIHALTVPVWKARRVARATRPLPLAGARWVDRQLLGRTGSLGVAELDRLVATAVARFSPQLHKSLEEQARLTWDVSVEHPHTWHGTSTLNARGDSRAVLEIQALVQDASDALPPSDDTTGQRRFHALALLVREGIDQSTLELSHTEVSETHPDRDGTSRRARTPRSNLHLVLHADLTDLPTEAVSIGIAEGLGPATLGLIKAWCGASHVTVQPVLNLADQAWSPRHDPPPRMARLVELRDVRCVFPYCARSARACDLDHIAPWDSADPPRPQIDPLGPPPHQQVTPPPTGTTAANLAPLCRRHHRAKTARRWNYERLPDGSFWWTGPQQQTALVTHAGTSTLP